MLYFSVCERQPDKKSKKKFAKGTIKYIVFYLILSYYVSLLENNRTTESHSKTERLQVTNPYVSLSMTPSGYCAKFKITSLR